MTQDEIEFALKKDPKNPVLVRKLADICYKEAVDFDTAFRMYQTLLVHHSHNMGTHELAEVFCRLGDIKAQINENRKAINMFEKALELESQHEPNLRGIISVYERLKNPKKVQKYREILLDPNSSTFQGTDGNSTVLKKLFGLLTLSIGLLIIGFVIHGVIYEGKASGVGLSPFQILFSIAFVFYGWRWFRGGTERNSGRTLLLAEDVGFIDAVTSESTSKILLVDNDPDFKNALSKLCGAKNKTLITADSGTQGLRLASSMTPSLIVLAVELPDQSGFNVCNKLKKNRETRSIPLIIVSKEATADTFRRHKALRLRADSYFSKSEALLSMFQTNQ